MNYNTFNINKLLEGIVTGSGTNLDLNKLFEDKLVEYNISKRKASDLLNIDLRTLDDTLAGNAKQPSIINIIKIAHFLEITDLYQAISAILKNQESENIGSIERASDASFIAKNFDIKKLTQVGFFKPKDEPKKLINRVLTFFGYSSVFEFERAVNVPLYSRTKRGYSDKMKDFWVKSAIQCFKDINNPNEYNREALKDIITKIKPYCQDVELGLVTVCKALYNVGVTVIFQSHLTLTQVRGGTFVINSKPCIVLTDLNKKYTTIWETLLHELHHVLYDLEAIEAKGYHLTGDPDLLLIEDKSEDFSREYFCGRDDYEYIKPHIHTHFLVERFAKELEVHPSFVYSSFRQFEQLLNNRNYYAHFKEYFPPYQTALQKLNPITWKENSLAEIAENIKSIFDLNDIKNEKSKIKQGEKNTI